MFADEVGNPCPPLLACILTTVAAYLLSRSRPGTVILAVAGVLVVGYLQFIYVENHVASAVMLLTSCGVVLAFRNYTHSRSEAGQHAQRALAALGGCVAVVVVILGLSCGFYAAVVAPLDPPTVDVKLIKEYLALPQVDMTGIADTSPTKDDQTTQNEDDNEEIASGTSSEKADTGDEGQGMEDSPADGADHDEYSEDADDAQYNPQTHTLPPVASAALWVLLAVLIAAAIVGIVRFKISRRSKRLRALLKSPPQERVSSAYLFALKRFKRMGVPDIGTHTPLEYAAAAAPFADEFAGDKPGSFAALTQAYTAVCYGKAQPTEEQLEQTKLFLEQFYSRSKAQLGKLKYALNFFFL